MEDEIQLKEALADLKVATRKLCLRMHSLSGVVRERCSGHESGEPKAHAGCCGSPSCKRKHGDASTHSE